MRGPALLDVLLVRAAEEAHPPGHPGAIPPEALVDAQEAAGSPADVDRWLATRAAFLLNGPLATLRPLAAMPGMLRHGVPVVGAGALVGGVFANYLGPSAKIHVLFNPIALLIVWNVAIYAAGAAAWVVRRVGRNRRLAPTQGSPSTSTASWTAPAAEPPSILARAVFGRLLPAAWFRLHRSVLAGAERAADLGTVARRFWQHWMHVAGPMLVPLGRRLLHVAAIGLALGAVLGMYARGLVFEYDVVWRSTFLTDPDGFLGLVRLALAPAAWLIGRPLPTSADAAALLTERGAPAAPWIHLYAASALLFIIVPRSALAVAATLRARRIERRLRLDPNDPYVADLLSRARAYRVGEVRSQIEADVQHASTRFAERLADFVCTRLYDAELAPAIRAFRERGGAVHDLEAQLTARCDAFRPSLDAEVARARQGFEADLTARVLARIGVSPSATAITRADVTDRVGAASGGASADLGRSLGHGLADVVAAAVTAALAVVAGTVSGGFGEAIGIAVLAGLLESGPIGWVVGALAAVLAAGAGLWLGGREALADSLKQMSLPSMITRTVLWSGRLEGILRDGRARCRDRVRELVGGELADLSDDIAEEIWDRIKPVLDERQRPRSIPSAD